MLIHNFLNAALSDRVIHGGSGPCGHAAIFSSDELQSPIRFINYNILPPQASFGLHAHGNDNEFYVVLEGQGVYTENGVERAVQAGDIIMNAAFAEHGIRNDGPGEMRLLVFEVLRETR